MPPEKLSNQQLAEIFQTIANLLEIKGEVIYKILAYRKAADSLNALSREAYELWQEGKLTEIPGVGKAIAEKIDELLSSGRLGFLEQLSAEVPPSLAEGRRRGGSVQPKRRAACGACARRSATWICWRRRATRRRSWRRSPACPAC